MVTRSFKLWKPDCTAVTKLLNISINCIYELETLFSIKLLRFIKEPKPSEISLLVLSNTDTVTKMLLSNLYLIPDRLKTTSSEETLSRDAIKRV
jgi:hypothetical protein